jgi:predicted nucleic acid-binding protein
MMMQYLVDTDWVIDYLNDREDIVQRLQELQHRAGLALSIISLAELYEGVPIRVPLKKMKPHCKIFFAA